MSRETMLLTLLTLTLTLLITLPSPVDAESGGWKTIDVTSTTDPYTRGVYLGKETAELYQTMRAGFSYMILETTGMELTFFEAKGVEIHGSHIPPALRAELQGVADGLGVAYEEVLGWNLVPEMVGSWWPSLGASQANPSAPPLFARNSHCSAFIATGSATADGRIVVGHTTFLEFWEGQFYSLIVKLAYTSPNDGNVYHLSMQTAPGYVASLTDWYVNTAGIVATETTIAGLMGYNPHGSPYFVRARDAAQNADSIESFVDILNATNSGGMAAMWLIGEVDSGRIAEFQQGLRYTQLSILSDGAFYGDNVPSNPQIRNLEIPYGGGWSDIRQNQGARRVVWPMLLDKHWGSITDQTALTMLADDYDPYLKRNVVSSRNICAVNDVTMFTYMSAPSDIWAAPFYPSGSTDAKAANATMLEQGVYWARWGRANGMAFDTQSFFDLNPQWAWQQPVLIDRPSQPVVLV